MYTPFLTLENYSLAHDLKRTLLLNVFFKFAQVLDPVKWSYYNYDINF